MLNNAHQSELKRISSAHQAEAKRIGALHFNKPLSYRLGSNPSTWPSLIVRSPLNSVKLYDALIPSGFAGVSNHYRAGEGALNRTLTEYKNLLAQDWAKKLLVTAEKNKALLKEYEWLRKDLENRLTAAEAKKVLEDPKEESIPWDEAKAELGL